MRGTRFGLALAIAAALPAAAHAQEAGRIQWAGLGNSFVATYKQANLTNISVWAGSAYQARFAAPVGAFGPAVDIYCVDFLHHANTGTNDAWFTKLDGVDALSKTRSNDLTLYLKAAWLVNQMEMKPISNQYDRADLHAAIWYMTAGSPISVLHSGVYTNAGMNYWLARANLEYNDGSINGADWRVVTDVCVAAGGTAGRGHGAADNCSQEFLTHNVVPEPATIILLGTGLLATLAMTGVLRRPEA